GPGGTITLTQNLTNTSSATAHNFEFRPASQPAIIGPSTANASGTNNGTLSLNNALRTFVTASDGNFGSTSNPLKGPNLYDAIINANISGGGTSGRFEKQGAGGIRFNGINNGLTGGNETQVLSVPNNITRFV